MFSLFNLFQKKKPASRRARPSQSATAAQTSTQQHTNIQRELIRVVLKDTLRLHGVPASWLTCEVVVMPRRVSDEDLIIQMIVLKWNETLLRYGPVLEKELLLGLDRFDPAVDHSGYMVSWRFAPGCGCPYAEMPAPSSWNDAGAANPRVPAPEPLSILDRRQSVRPAPGPKFDLPPSDRDYLTPDFAATEPSALK